MIKGWLYNLGLWLITHMRSEQKFEDDIYIAVKEAYLYVGLPEEMFSKEFDLVRANKLTQVYHIAAGKLGINPELNTVGDVMKWLKS